MGKLGDQLRQQGAAVPPPLIWRPRPELLLCPNVPAPLHGLAPRVLLGSKWWDETRKEAYRSTDYHCLACGVYHSQARFSDRLEGHEVYTVNYDGHYMKYVETVPLCYCCHNFIHDGRLMALLEAGEITQARYVAVIQHGNRVLRQAGLTRRSPMERSLLLNLSTRGEWRKWRLVIGRRRYGPAFRSQEEWEAAHAKSKSKQEE